MSLCYDFEKWTMISLASVAISLTIGLVSLAYGQTLDNETAMQEANKLILQTLDNETALNKLIQVNPSYTEQKQRESLINYCFQHADRPNPLQDLVDKGFLPEGFKETCKSVKQTYDKVQTKLEAEKEVRFKELLKEAQAGLKEQQENSAKFKKCFRDAITIQNITVDDCSRLYTGNSTK